MPLDITAELQKAFDEAVMQQEAKSLKQGQDWQQARNIIEGGEAERTVLQEKYVNEFDTRVEIVSKRLTNEAGDKNFDHPTPTGRDKFDGEAITRQAKREVEHDHARVLQQSRDNQDAAMDALQGTAQERNLQEYTGKAPEKMKDQFACATDRRQAPERRR